MRRALVATPDRAEILHLRLDAFHVELDGATVLEQKSRRARGRIGHVEGHAEKIENPVRLVAVNTAAAGPQNPFEMQTREAPSGRLVG